MFLSQLCKIVNGLPPIDGAGGKATVYVDMSKYTHLTAIIVQGVGAPPTVTVEKSATGVNGASGTAIDFNYRLNTGAYAAAGGDTLGDLTAVGGAGGVATSTNDNTFMVIELDATELGSGYPYVRVVLSTVTNLESIVLILSGARYQEPGTALTV